MSFRVNEDNTMERYVAFICSELRDEYDVILNEPKRLDGSRPPIKKIGPWVKSKVNVTILETYTRSAKLRLKFGNEYVVEDIFYMSRHKSPDKLLEEIYTKIDKLVNKTYIENGRENEIREMYRVKHEKFNQKIKQAFENLKFKIDEKENQISQDNKRME